jgi:hypothetical protein
MEATRATTWLTSCSARVATGGEGLTHPERLEGASRRQSDALAEASAYDDAMNAAQSKWSARIAGAEQA